MEGLVVTLMFGSLGFVLVVAYLNMRCVEKLKDEGQPRFPLARGGIQRRLQAVTTANHRTN